MKVDKFGDETRLIMDHTGSFGTSRRTMVILSELGRKFGDEVRINIGLGGDMAPADARRLAHILLVAADMADES